MSEQDRRMRAVERQSRAVLRYATAGGVDPNVGDVWGEEAISLTTRLTEECWSLGGRPWPLYSRDDTPYRFVPTND
jgi:hypothetical protein